MTHIVFYIPISVLYIFLSSPSDDGSSKKSTKSESSSTGSSPCEGKASNITMMAKQMELQLNLGNHEVPENICDFDKDNWDDIFQVSHYAMDIFNYLKSREVSVTLMTLSNKTYLWLLEEVAILYEHKIPPSKCRIH